MRVGHVARRNNDDIALAISDLMLRVRIVSAQVADVIVRVGDRVGIRAATQKLANVVPRGVLANLRMAIA